jgi:hypothetical protein
MQRDPDTVNRIGREAIKPFFYAWITDQKNHMDYIPENFGCSRVIPLFFKKSIIPDQSNW